MVAAFDPSVFTHLGLTPQFAFVTVTIVAVLLVLTTGGAVMKKAVQVDRKPCPDCGGENPGFAGFCRHCGTRFPQD